MSQPKAWQSLSCAPLLTLHTTPASPPDVLPTPDPTATAALLRGFLPRPPRWSPRFSVSESGGPAKTQVRPGHVAALSYRSRRACHRGLRGLPLPSLAHVLLVALTGFLPVPPAPPTCPHPRASHSSPPHLPHVPAQEGPPDNPTLWFRLGFCHSTCHFLPYYIIYPLIWLFSFVLALHYNVYRDF